MHSLISRYSFRLHGVATMLAIAVFSTQASAANDFGRMFLEEPTLTVAGNEGEIHIHFASEVRYIRHAPERSGGVLHISLEVVDPCVAEDVLTQETKWLRHADCYRYVRVSFAV